MTALVLHVICRDWSGVTWDSDSVFVSASWRSSRPNVDWIALPETRISPSYAQGRVIDSWCDPQRPKRKKFRASWIPTSAIWPQPMCSGVLQYGQPEVSFPTANDVQPLHELGVASNIVDSPQVSQNLAMANLPQQIMPADSLYVMITQGNHSRVKVGRSHNPHTRAQQLSAGHPELIVVFHVWPCRGPLERFVHDRFAPLNVQNGGPGREWFNVNSDMAVTLIDSLVSGIDIVDALVMQST